MIDWMIDWMIDLEILFIIQKTTNFNMHYGKIPFCK